MSLELKHLAAYLPYGLMLSQYREDLNINAQSELVSLSADKMRVLLQRFPYSEDVAYNEVKPILRPLSGLTKEIEHNGEKFIPFNYLTEKEGNRMHIALNYDGELLFQPKDISSIWTKDMIRITNKLFEWHFDVFGLIEKGLAISYNDLVD